MPWFRRDDLQPVARRPGEGRHQEPDWGQVSSIILFEDAYEQVRIDEWAARASINIPNARGLELLVLSGGITEGGEELSRWSWLRLPPGEALHARAGESGVRAWIKSAPLLHETVCAF